MKGIILSEFVEFLELSLGNDSAQDIIDEAGIDSQGVYTRVGQYDYQELIHLLTQSVAKTGIDQNVLLNDFSEHLFLVFKRDYGLFFEGVDSAVEMLMQVDNHIHVEVLKLYPDAELPRFESSVDGQLMTLYYKSPRPLASVALALVGACLKYFGNSDSLLSSELHEDHKSAKFVISIAS